MIEDRSFNSLSAAEILKLGLRFENCNFSLCDFASSDLSSVHFQSCAFEDTDLSSAVFSETGIRECIFKNCKLLGLHFEDVLDFMFSAQFDHNLMDYCTFSGKDIRRCGFIACRLTACDFTEANVSGIDFKECDLSEAVFDSTDLRMADLSTARNFSINPNDNILRGAIFSRDGIGGLLRSFDIIISDA